MISCVDYEQSHVASDRIQEALQAFERAEHLDPKNPSPKFQRALVLLKLDKFKVLWFLIISSLVRNH